MELKRLVEEVKLIFGFKDITELRDALSPKLMSGEIRVNQDED